MRFKDRFLPCATNTLVNTRLGRPFAQAARSLCDSLEQRRDLGTCPTFISLTAELVACRTSRQRRSRQYGRDDLVVIVIATSVAMVVAAGTDAVAGEIVRPVARVWIACSNTEIGMSSERHEFGAGNKHRTNDQIVC